MGVKNSDPDFSIGILNSVPNVGPTGVRPVSDNKHEDQQPREKPHGKEPVMICESTTGIMLPYGTKDIDPRVLCVSQLPWWVLG